MASADGSIRIRTQVDTTGIKNGTKSIESGVQKMNNSFLKLASTMATVFSVAVLINFGKQAINLASDLQEVQNVVDVAFGDMAYKIEEFSDTAIENFGLSELSAKSMASTFMAMANGMGQGLDVASDMAVELTGRLADIMSFYNKSISEVETIGRAVYSGETEPLKAIGVIMTEAQLQTFALAHGYQQLYKDMSAADKLLVRQQYFLETTNQAAGDFLKTQDSWANQTRILSERWKEFLTLVGGRLIQVLAPVVTLLNNLLSSAIAVGNALAKIFGWETSVASSTGAIASNVSDTADSQEELASSTNSTNKALKKQLAFFDDINVLASESASSGSGGGTGVSTGTGTTGGGQLVETTKTEENLSKLELKLKGFFDSFNKFIQPTKDALSDLWNNGLSLFGNFAITGLKDFYDEFLVPIGKWAFSNPNTGFPRLFSIIDDALSDINWDKLNKSLKDFWKAIEPYAEEFGNGLLDFFEGLSDIGVDIINLFGPAMDGITSALNNGNPEDARSWGKALGELAVGMVAVRTAIGVTAGMSAFLSWIQGLGAAAGGLTGITAFFSAMNPGMIGQFGITLEKLTMGTILDTRTWSGLPKQIDDSIMASLESISSSIEGFFAYTFEKIFNFDATQQIWGMALDNFSKISIAWEEQDWLSLGGNLIAGIFNGIMGAVALIIEPIADLFATIGGAAVDGFKSAFKGIESFFIGIINGIVGLFEGLVNTVIDGLNTVIKGFNSLPGMDMDLIASAKFGRIAIPGIATGSTTPSNSAFQQIMQDPFSSSPMTVQGMAEAIKQALGTQTSSTSGQVVNLNVDGETFARLTLPNTLSEMNRQGYNTVILGVN